MTSNCASWHYFHFTTDWKKGEWMLCTRETTWKRRLKCLQGAPLLQEDELGWPQRWRLDDILCWNGIKTQGKTGQMTSPLYWDLCLRVELWAWGEWSITLLFPHHYITCHVLVIFCSPTLVPRAAEPRAWLHFEPLRARASAEAREEPNLKKGWRL